MDSLTSHGTKPYRPLLVTRGNVDGICSAALILQQETRHKVNFQRHSHAANDFLRTDLSHSHYTLADLSLNDVLVKTLNRKASTGIDVHVIDHHMQSAEHQPHLHEDIQFSLNKEGSAASGVFDALEIHENYEFLAAIADHIDETRGPHYQAVLESIGEERLHHEALMLDYSWRHDLHDDRFRHLTARALATGRWPSQIPEVKRRYLRMKQGNFWEKAVARIRSRMTIQSGVAFYDGTNSHVGLSGFGSRAVTAVAIEEGADVACRLHRNRLFTSLALRRCNQEHDLDLGAFLQEFTEEHGVIGGGHATAAGGRIPQPSTPTFKRNIVAVC